MKLHSICIKGFAGIPYDDNLSVTIAPLGRMNILIGPNNAGKSTVIRFLLKFASWMSKKNWTVDSEVNAADCWRYDLRLSANIELDCDDDFVEALNSENDNLKVPLQKLRNLNNKIIFKIELKKNKKKLFRSLLIWVAY